MILSGLVVTSFAALISVRERSWKYLCWTVPLALAGIDLAMIGLFPENAGIIHYVLSVTFFTLLGLTMLTYSYAS